MRVHASFQGVLPGWWIRNGSRMTVPSIQQTLDGVLVRPCGYSDQSLTRTRPQSAQRVMGFCQGKSTHHESSLDQLLC